MDIPYSLFILYGGSSIWQSPVGPGRERLTCLGLLTHPDGVERIGEVTARAITPSIQTLGEFHLITPEFTPPMSAGAQLSRRDIYVPSGTDDVGPVPTAPVSAFPALFATVRARPDPFRPVETAPPQRRLRSGYIAHC